MIKRKLVERKCPLCEKIEYVRKDGVGIYCRPCRAKINSKNKQYIDISGKKFGKLTVVSFSHIKKHSYWNCICECGNNSIVDSAKLKNGQTKSCGCLQSSRKGLSRTSTYNSWRAMLQRCYDVKVPHYKRYGAKGIIVCERWKNSFENFLLDMGERPIGKTLDRIDPNGNYEALNCRWLTPQEQAKNKNSGFFIEAFGKKLRLSEWAELTGINWSTIRQRIVRSKWTAEEALSEAGLSKKKKK